MTQLCLDAPLITKFRPALGGLDNDGIGSTQYGEEYLLKADPSVAVAEFVGASICRKIGIPTPEPTVVLYNDQKVFGSRLEGGVKTWQETDDLLELIKCCDNLQAFSAVLAVDVAIGNIDRHWNNWLYQEKSENTISVRAIDFSRSWPTVHPPASNHDLVNSRTHRAWSAWSYVGISFDQTSADHALDTMHKLDKSWLSDILDSLPGEWYVAHPSSELKDWWEKHWTSQVAQTTTFIHQGAWSTQP